MIDRLMGTPTEEDAAESGVAEPRQMGANEKRAVETGAEQLAAVVSKIETTDALERT